jgi:chemotaxis protein MotA
MDLATIIGFLSGAGLILSAIVMGGSAGIFVNIPGILIVFGGTFATAFIKFTLQDVFNSIKVGLKAFLVKVDPPEEIIATMIGYAKIAKKEGLISLDQENPKDPYMAKALRYLSDGYDEKLIEDMLNKEIRQTVTRHATGQNVFKGMGDSAPAFGMIGTLIGLVQMLSSMSDPASIGPSMAVALLTTLYGALVANFICLPLAEKLVLRSQQEQQRKAIIREAAVGINQAQSPMVLEESLRIYLAPAARDKKAKNEPESVEPAKEAA